MEQFGSQSLVSYHILLCYICYRYSRVRWVETFELATQLLPSLVRREQTTAAVIFVQLV